MLVEHLSGTINNIRQNKTRAFLTMLGIIIGIAGVIMIISVGAGAQSIIINQIKDQGSNLLAIFPGNTDEEGPPAAVFGITITTLTNEDILSLKNSKRLQYVEDVSSYVQGTDTVSWKGNTAEATFIGSSYAVPNVESAAVEYGNFFTVEDEKSLQRVAVLGADIAENIFGDENPIGEKIKIEKHNFKIIGVMEKRGSSGFSNNDTNIYIPVTTAQKLLLGINHISFARVKISDESQIERTAEIIEEILKERHDIDIGGLADFDVKNQKDALDVLFSITNAITLFLTSIASIALLVGSIGIMNIMLVAVQERIREIGLRKAVGATKKDIFLQFLIETIFMTLIAGIVGILIGIAISYVIAIIVQSLNYEWHFSISTLSIILGAGVSGFIGLLSGIVPAIKAGKLNPIEALTYE